MLDHIHTNVEDLVVFPYAIELFIYKDGEQDKGKAFIVNIRNKVDKINDISNICEILNLNYLECQRLLYYIDEYIADITETDVYRFSDEVEFDNIVIVSNNEYYNVEKHLLYILDKK